MSPPFILFLVSFSLLCLLQFIYLDLATAVVTFFPLFFGFCFDKWMMSSEVATLIYGPNPKGPRYNTYQMLSIIFSIAVTGAMYGLIGPQLLQVLPIIFCIVTLATVTIGRKILKSQN